MGRLSPRLGAHVGSSFCTRIAGVTPDWLLAVPLEDLAVSYDRCFVTPASVLVWHAGLALGSTLIFNFRESSSKLL